MDLKIVKRKKLRIRNIFIFIALLIIEVLIALFVHDEFTRPYLGDMLVVVVLYFFVRIFVLEKYRLLPLYIFLFATGVEFLQYFNFIKILGVSDNLFLRVLIGSVFDIKDIFCYGVGSLILGGYEWIKFRNENPSKPKKTKKNQKDDSE